MKTIRRWISNGLVAGSLFILISLSVLWIRNAMDLSDQFGINFGHRSFWLACYRGEGMLATVEGSQGRDLIVYQEEHGVDDTLDYIVYGPFRRFIIFRWGKLALNGGNASIRFIGLANWQLFPIAAIWPLWLITRRIKHRRRNRLGLCGVCGYDLRASPDRCPECGINRQTF